MDDNSKIRKIIKTTLNEWLNEQINDLMNKMKDFLIDDRYLFHYTQTEYLPDILKEGLIPRKYPNSNYPNGAKGVFLTTSYSLYNANLPESLMELMDDYYENEDNYNEKPLVRLTIDVTKLDVDKFTWDDDYIKNVYGWNKANTDTEKIIESLELWRSVAYLENIPPNLIVKYDFDYNA